MANLQIFFGRAFRPSSYHKSGERASTLAHALLESISVFTSSTKCSIMLEIVRSIYQNRGQLYHCPLDDEFSEQIENIRQSKLVETDDANTKASIHAEKIKAIKLRLHVKKLRQKKIPRTLLQAHIGVFADDRPTILTDEFNKLTAIFAHKLVESNAEDSDSSDSDSFSDDDYQIEVSTLGTGSDNISQLYTHFVIPEH